jgi:hypothetical protein
MKKYCSREIIICFLAVFFLATCKIPYNPVLKSSDTNSLVVEGYIDGAAPTSFKLSRSRRLSNGDTATRRVELNARVSIEDDHQNIFPLNEEGNGVYSSTGILNFSTASQYRIHIITSNGSEYLSDLVPFKPSPPIDSIGWKIKDNGVQIFLNTSDPNNSTKYYRWEYNETWQFHTSYYSNYEYDPNNNTVVPRTDQVYTCWQSDNSTAIFLGSSAKLANDVINEAPLAYIPPHDDKLSVLYSIWVKQYVLDANGYNYWIAMKSNTESVGSIFDPQPNETQGNIHCISDPAETVIGYINAGSSFEKRVFISNGDLPPGWNLLKDCPLYPNIPNNPDSLKFYFGGGGFTPIGVADPPRFPPAGYTASFIECVDCTFKGTNIKPSFWP